MLQRMTKYIAVELELMFCLRLQKIERHTDVLELRYRFSWRGSMFSIL